MRFIKTVFETKMFLVILTLFILYVTFFAPSGVNRTIMWGAFDKLGHYNKLCFQFILLFYFLLYGILSLFKRKTNKKISIFQTITIVISILILKQQPTFIFLILSLLSLILFIINVILSVKKINL